MSVSELITAQPLTNAVAITNGSASVLVCDSLMRWPTLQEVKKVKRPTPGEVLPGA